MSSLTLLEHVKCLLPIFGLIDVLEPDFLTVCDQQFEVYYVVINTQDLRLEKLAVNYLALCQSGATSA